MASGFTDCEHMDLITAREDDSAVVGQLIRRMPGERGEAAPALEFGESWLAKPRGRRAGARGP